MSKVQKPSYKNEKIKKLLSTPFVPLGFKEIEEVCKEAKECLSKLPNVVKLERGSCKVTVVGDIHGQFGDLVHVLSQVGYPEVGKHKYVFLGDFINRSDHGLPVVMLLFSLIVELGADNVVLLRGNHEAEQICNVYGFKKEVEEKFGKEQGKKVYELVLDVMKYLPIAAVIEDKKEKVLCVHAGLSQYLTKVEEIEKIKRTMMDLVDYKGRESKDIDWYSDDITKEEKIFVDLLWADPIEKKEGEGVFGKSPRGVSYTFTEDWTKKFCKENGLTKIIRSHQLVNEGFKSQHGDLLITIFSASNYCATCGNKGAVVTLSEDEKFKPFYYNVNLSVTQRFCKLQGLFYQKKEKEIAEKEIEEIEKIIEKEYQTRKKFLSELKKKKGMK